MKGAKRNILGNRFGKLVVTGETPKREGRGYVVWTCKCDCGNVVDISGRYLTAKNKPRTSCGCDTHEKRAMSKTTHGKSRTRLYRVYRTMVCRCENPNAHEYENYGGRGISVCKEWKDYTAFEKWATENGYDETAKRGRCTLDRIDTNGNYCPENCRWVDMKTQQRNRRNSIRLSHNGETHALTEWAEILGVKYVTLQKRHSYGWSTQEILFGR